MTYHFVEKTIDSFNVGDSYCFSKTVTEADVVMFAAVSGDMAPQHVNAEYAKGTPAGERVAHGMLTASLVSAALNRMLSPGAVIESCEFSFAGPVRFGDTITARVEVTEKHPSSRRLKLRAVCTNQRDEIVLEGTSVQVMAGRAAMG